MHLISDLVRRRLEVTRQPFVAELLEAGYHDVFPEALPALARVPGCADDPTAIVRGTGEVVQLPLRQAPIVRVVPLYPRFVLLPRTAWELVHDAECHLASSCSFRSDPTPGLREQPRHRPRSISAAIGSA